MALGKPPVAAGMDEGRTFCLPRNGAGKGFLAAKRFLFLFFIFPSFQTKMKVSLWGFSLADYRGKVEPWAWVV